LRFWLAATLDFRSDEATTGPGRTNGCCPTDHPAEVAWSRHRAAIFGDTHARARFGQLLHCRSSNLLAILRAAVRGSGTAALFVVLVLGMHALLFAIVFGARASVPMLVFISALLWACRLDESMDGRWWLFVGVARRQCFSKLLVFLLAPALLMPPSLKAPSIWLATRSLVRAVDRGGDLVLRSSRLERAARLATFTFHRRVSASVDRCKPRVSKFLPSTSSVQGCC